MQLRFTTPLVVSACVGLAGLLLVSAPHRVAATDPGNDSKPAAGAKVQNETKKALAPLEKFRLQMRAARQNVTGPESKPANPYMAGTDALMHTLDREISTKDLFPNSFYGVLSHLTDKMREVGKELPFFVDASVFSKDVQAVNEGQIPPPLLKPQSLPPRMSVRAILQMALPQFDGGEATFLIRQRRVEITTKKAAALHNLLQQTVAASFDRQPLEFVLDDLSEITGVSVVLDGRAQDKMRTPITARFRNDVSLLEALRMVTASAGLKLVELPGGPTATRALFVTTPEHAQLLQR
jgi:hypothetical protein